MRKSALQIEIEALSNEELIDAFDAIETTITRQENFRRTGATKLAKNRYDIIRKEILRRMEG